MINFRLQPVSAAGRSGTDELGAGAERGEVPQPHQVYRALQQHVLLDQDPHTQPTRREGGLPCFREHV